MLPDTRISLDDDLRCLATSPAKHNLLNVLLEAPLTLLSCICIALFMSYLGNSPGGLAEVVSRCHSQFFMFLARSTFSTCGCFA